MPTADVPISPEMKLLIGAVVSEGPIVWALMARRGKSGVAGRSSPTSRVNKSLGRQ